MQMDMKNGLPCSRVAIHRDPVAIFSKPFLPGNIPCCKKELADCIRVGFIQIIDGRDVSPRHDQNVRRRLWIDVTKCDRIRRFMDDVGGNFIRDNLGKILIAKFYLRRCSSRAFNQSHACQKTRATRYRRQRTPVHHPAALHGRYDSPGPCVSWRDPRGNVLLHHPLPSGSLR